MFADELVGREAFEGLQSSTEIVGADEVGEVISQLFVVVVMEAFHGRFLDRAVHAFDLAVRPRVFDLGEPVVDLMFPADTVKDVLEGINVPIMICELDAIVGQKSAKEEREGNERGEWGCGSAGSRMGKADAEGVERKRMGVWHGSSWRTYFMKRRVEFELQRQKVLDFAHAETLWDHLSFSSVANMLQA